MPWWTAPLRPLLRAGVRSLRVDLPADDPFHAAAGGAAVAVFHGELFLGLPLVPGRPTAALVSRSRDGDIAAGLLAALAVRCVRGSTGKGGAAARAGAVEAAQAGCYVVVAVDGPRGPRHAVAPGAAAIAAEAGRPLLAMRMVVEGRASVLRTWDRFVLPWPGACVRIATAAVDAGAGPAAVAAALEAVGRGLREGRAARGGGVAEGGPPSAPR